MLGIEECLSTSASARERQLGPLVFSPPQHADTDRRRNRAAYAADDRKVVSDSGWLGSKARDTDRIQGPQLKRLWELTKAAALFRVWLKKTTKLR